MINQDHLKSLLTYNPDTGVFTWRKMGRGVPKTLVAGGIVGNGYRYIRIDGILYKASRLAWLYTTGKWPKDCIDHIDGNPLNDALGNLRDVTPSQNGCNRTRLNKNNTSGYTGVIWHKKAKKWCAQLKVRRTNIYLGLFDTIEDAVAARNKASWEHHGVFGVRSNMTK